IDVLAMARAFASNLMAGRIVSGASTITQQLVRIKYPDRLPENPYLRKPVEALYALKLSAHESKPNVLEEFIQLVPLGRNRKGFFAGARFYFDRELSVLSCEEQALLVVLLRRTSMGQKSLQKRLDQLVERSGEDPALQKQCGWQGRKKMTFPVSYRFYRSEQEDESEQTAGRSDSPRESEEQSSSDLEAQEHSDGHSSDAIAHGYPHSAPHLGVFLFHSMGVRGPVSTELDAALQSEIQAIIRSELAMVKAKGANQAAVIVLEKSKDADPVWDMRAMIGSSDFDGQEGQVNGALAVNDAGSVLKPFLYALAMEDLGLRPGSPINDSEYSITDALHREVYSPRNHDLRFSGWITLREALAGSRNVPAVRLIERLGPERFYQLLKEAGFEHMQEPARDYGPSLALGTGGATLFEIALLYGALAAEGEMLPVRIADSPAIQFGQRKRIFRENTALLIRHILSDFKARRGSFGNRSFLDFPFDVAAKTGTSKDFRDSWAVGYTERYVVAVWVGNFRSEPTLGVSGARGAGRIMHQIMRMLYQDSNSHFRYPDNWKYLNICKRTGLQAGPNCPQWTEPFLPEDVPPPVCDGHHEASQSNATGILHPLPDQVFILDSHRPPDSQAISIEIRSEAKCSYRINDRTKPMPADGHLHIYMDPRPGRYRLELVCDGNVRQARNFRIED
ncbi:MAG: transglycosylase domain-containing protein, partial [Leptospiraceae bacterium]|nr:transglycosylase domain-containing protein [Leptospiraceae bacterium]